MAIMYRDAMYDRMVTPHNPTLPVPELQNQFYGYNDNPYGHGQVDSNINDHNGYLANMQRNAAQEAYYAQHRAAPNTSEDRIALENELVNNEAKIAELQTELTQLSSKWSNMDEFDRKLAANRAKVGDFANSRAHQQDIVNRQDKADKWKQTQMQWKWQEKQNRLSREDDKIKQAKAEIKRLTADYEDTAVLLANPDLSPQQAKEIESKLDRIKRDLADYGVVPGGNGQPKQATSNNVGARVTKQSIEKYILDHKDKDGNLSNAEIAEAERMFGELGDLDTDQKNSLWNDIQGNKKHSREAVAARREKRKKDNADALDEAIKNKRQDGEYEATNGIKVKVTVNNGKRSFFINGKLVKKEA